MFKQSFTTREIYLFPINSVREYVWLFPSPMNYPDCDPRNKQVLRVAFYKQSAERVKSRRNWKLMTLLSRVDAPRMHRRTRCTKCLTFDSRPEVSMCNRYAGLQTTSVVTPILQPPEGTSFPGVLSNVCKVKGKVRLFITEHLTKLVSTHWDERICITPCTVCTFMHSRVLLA